MDSPHPIMSTSQSRHVYTREERLILEASFARQSHPNVEEKERLAKLFNCNLIQISNWFQNHRRRLRKLRKSETTVSINSTIHTSPVACPIAYYNYQQPEYHYVHYHDVGSCCSCTSPASCYYPPAVYSQTNMYEPNVTHLSYYGYS